MMGAPLPILQPIAPAAAYMAELRKILRCALSSMNFNVYSRDGKHLARLVVAPHQLEFYD